MKYVILKLEQIDALLSVGVMQNGVITSYSGEMIHIPKNHTMEIIVKRRYSVHVKPLRKKKGSPIVKETNT